MNLSRPLVLLAAAVWLGVGAPAPAQELTVKRVGVTPARAAPGEEVVLGIDLEITYGWHVYGALETVGDKPRVELDEGVPAEVLADRTELPGGEAHDSYGIESFWIQDAFTLRQPVRLAAGAPPGTVALAGAVQYMICNEQTCLPPKSVAFTAKVEVTAAAGDAAGTGTPPDAASATGVAPVTAGPTTPEEWAADGLLAFLLAAVGAGIFALVMPCTYPMIPITISFFTKQAQKQGGTALGLSVAYGVGIVAAFVAIGLAVGEPIIRFASAPIPNLVIGALFVVFALSLFGLFALEPPRFLMDAAGRASARGGYLGVFLMGTTLVVTSFTCSAPFIGSLLAIGARQGQHGRVALGMTVFGLTMAIPFVALSLLPGRASRLPKAGQWMNTAKVFFGYVEVAAALKFFSNAELAWGWYALPAPLFLGAWVVLFFLGGLYLLGTFGVPAAIGWRQKASGILSLGFAFYCTWGAAGGTLDARVMTALAPPYRHFGGDSGREQPGRLHAIVENDYQAALAAARDQDKALLLNFTGVT